MADAEGAERKTEGLRLPLWVVSLIFVGGIGCGVILVGLLGLGTPAFPSGTSGGAGASTAPGGGQVSVAAQAQVNAACLRVINEAESVSGILSDVPGATQEVDLPRLDELVRQLQPIQPRLQQDLTDCRVSVEAAGGAPSPSESALSAAPTGSVPTPTSTPTGPATGTPTSPATGTPTG